jgi:hypothetical protein
MNKAREGLLVEHKKTYREELKRRSLALEILIAHH